MFNFKKEKPADVESQRNDLGSSAIEESGKPSSSPIAGEIKPANELASSQGALLQSNNESSIRKSIAQDVEPQVASKEPASPPEIGLKKMTINSNQDRSFNMELDQFSPPIDAKKAVGPESPLHCTESQLFEAQEQIKMGKELIASGKIHTLVHESMTVHGDIDVSEGSGFATNGKVNGNIKLTGTSVLYVGHKSVIKGEVVAPYIVCEGRIEGQVSCKRLIASKTSVLTGKIAYSESFVPYPFAKVNSEVCFDQKVEALFGVQAKPANVSSISAERNEFLAEANQISRSTSA